MDSFQQQREKAFSDTKTQIRGAYANEEFALMQAINAYLETVRSYNLAYERLAEWYGIYYPEVKVGSQEMLAELALALNERSKASLDAIKAVVKDDKKSADIYAKATSSIGREMNEGECKALLRFAQLSKEAKTTLDELDGYIKIAAESIMPNITYITDAKIAAELLSKAGSLERLATMPASTLQLLGAEKALFKHLKFGSKPPKYGVLFKLQEVSSARKEFRGRIARVYATKLSIASRADAFSKRFIAKELKEMIEKTIKNMRVSKTRPKPWENKAPRRDWGNKNQKSSWSDRPQGQRGPRTGGQPQNFRPRERPNNFRPKN